jgi:hypothetical protein
VRTEIGIPFTKTENPSTPVDGSNGRDVTPLKVTYIVYPSEAMYELELKVIVKALNKFSSIIFIY